MPTTGARHLNPRRRRPLLADFPHDNFIPLRHVAERTNNIAQWTQYERGGHFAAMEQPELLVGDIRTFFEELREQARG